MNITGQNPLDPNYTIVGSPGGPNINLNPNQGGVDWSSPQFSPYANVSGFQDFTTAYNQTPGGTRYNPGWDIDQSGAIDFADFLHFGGKEGGPDFTPYAQDHPEYGWGWSPQHPSTGFTGGDDGDDGATKNPYTGPTVADIWAGAPEGFGQYGGPTAADIWGAAPEGFGQQGYQGPSVADMWAGAPEGFGQYGGPSLAEIWGAAPEGFGQPQGYQGPTVADIWGGVPDSFMTAIQTDLSGQIDPLRTQIESLNNIFGSLQDGSFWGVDDQGVNIGPPNLSLADRIKQYQDIFGIDTSADTGADTGAGTGAGTGGDTGDGEPAATVFDYSTFDPSADAPGIIDDTGAFRGPLADMILGRTGASQRLGQEYLAALDAENPFSAQYEDVFEDVIDPETGEPTGDKKRIGRQAKQGSVLGELEGMLKRSSDREMENIVNRFSATNKLGSGSFREALSDQMNKGFLDQLAQARIGFGLEEARTSEDMRRNRLADLGAFNQGLINNLSTGLDQAQALKQSDIGAQQAAFQANMGNFYDFLAAQQGAEGWTQGMEDAGLDMFLRGQGGNPQQNAMLQGATAGLGNIMNQPQSDPWGNLSQAILAYQYGRPKGE